MKVHSYLDLTDWLLGNKSASQFVLQAVYSVCLVAPTPPPLLRPLAKIPDDVMLAETA